MSFSQRLDEALEPEVYPDATSRLKEQVNLLKHALEQEPRRIQRMIAQDIELIVIAMGRRKFDDPQNTQMERILLSNRDKLERVLDKLRNNEY